MIDTSVQISGDMTDWINAIGRVKAYYPPINCSSFSLVISAEEKKNIRFAITAINFNNLLISYYHSSFCMIGYPICADASVLFKDSTGFLRRNVVQNVHSTNGSSKYAVVFSNSIVLNTSSSHHSTVPRTSDATDSPSVVSCTSVVSTIIKKVVVPYLSFRDNSVHAVQNLYKGILLVGPPGTHILTRHSIILYLTPFSQALAKRTL